MNRRKRKSTPVVFGGRVSDEALLMQRQIEEPEPENQDFSWLTNRRAVDNAVQPTGRRSKGNSGAYAPLNHEHPTALIPTSDPQEPVENELRFDGGGFLRRRIGTSWELIPPLASSATPQPTGTASAGTSLDYSRADHSHATALLLQSNSQTPVNRELRLNSNNELVFWDGSAWQPIEIDASNLNNPPTTGITVRKNSGSNVGTRPRLNFIEGTNITITVADDNTDDEIDITINSSAAGNTPYTNTPEPTGVASAGTSNDFSRGDHSHATALIAQTNSQTPVERELRYNSADALVMRVGTAWVPVKVDWGDVLNQPTIPSPSTATPQPTGTASAGSSANYSRGDHSHPTAILPQSDSQTPVNDEIRYNTNNKLVRWNGSAWVELSVESSTTPVQSTSTYSEQGTNNGEIWYRTNDRAFFFRVGNQRVYPAAALFTVSESAVSTGAGNRILLLDSTANNLLRIGGSENQTVFAYPKLPMISGQMSSSNANWSTGAGTTPTGALWYNISTGRPEFYPNATTAEPFYVERLFFNTNSLGVGAFASSLPNGMVRICEGGNLIVKCGDGSYVHGWGGCFDLVGQGIVRATSAASIVDGTLNTSIVRSDDLFTDNILSFLYDKYIELGDASDTVLIFLPIGFLHLSSGALGSNIVGFWQLPFVRISGTNTTSWRLNMILIRASSGSNREVYDAALHSSPSVVSAGAELYVVGGLFSRNWANWDYWVNGVFQSSTTVPSGTYLALLYVRRVRSSETAPRMVVRLRWMSASLNLPINRLRYT